MNVLPWTKWTLSDKKNQFCSNAVFSQRPYIIMVAKWCFIAWKWFYLNWVVCACMLYHEQTEPFLIKNSILFYHVYCTVLPKPCIITVAKGCYIVWKWFYLNLFSYRLCCVGDVIIVVIRGYFKISFFYTMILHVKEICGENPDKWLQCDWCVAKYYVVFLCVQSTVSV